MDATGKTIWQQAAGDTEREYAHLCVTWGVILNGPGFHGSWPKGFAEINSERNSTNKTSDLRRFAVEMQSGDLVVLRIGTATVMAVGEIVGEYSWHDNFGDVDGWDLEHVRRVRWYWHDVEQPKTFPTYTLKQGDTTQRLTSEAVIEWLATLEVDPSRLISPLPDLPADTAMENDDESVLEQSRLLTISNALFDRGVASVSIEHLLGQIGELNRIARWYARVGAPSEHETVAYLVVPLLRALGWTPQRMAVEWNYVDVALFSGLPRADPNLRVVVEAKRLHNACLSAVGQARSYALNKSGCDRLLVTDGIRYGVFVRTSNSSRQDGADGFRLHAYLNLLRLRFAYPVYQCGGVVDALSAMTPDWLPN